MSTNKPEFLSNLNAGQRWNKWHAFEHASVYMRVSHRLVEGHITHTVQIANISMDEQHQHKGTFVRLIKAIRAETNAIIIIENVLNEQWFNKLLKRGFLPLHANIETTSLYLPVGAQYIETANNDNGKIDLSDMTFGRLLDHVPDERRWNIYHVGSNVFVCNIADADGIFFTEQSSKATSPEQALRLALVALDPTKFQTT